MRRVVGFVTAWTVVGVPALMNPSSAWADDLVTYEVISDAIRVANIEYENSAGRVSEQNVILPWRTEAIVRTVRGAPPDGSQVRADWRPSAGPSKWVTVRISYQGKIICQNTLDVGNAACYGITERIT